VKSNLAGTLVGKISCHVHGYLYQVCTDTMQLPTEAPWWQSSLEYLWHERPGSKGEERFYERVHKWKELAQTFLVESYTL